ncbi:4a-hydroxytetrahydrobiopterin dehydratase [Massilia antarctica]|uniref:Putative pterin-4-alpha-carbinolamine dehydratase n=1 Tax=Massilia antarctica TaxID=2765360 RepID=A0AA48W5L6_9BURK|nr:4a-hydroxytetrahydrobiopterin dehydratase [Massilia antarctica]QPI47408.1 4a-hydroxytetrahydrobiopterin dehydratase [Massilia antarctica]
MSLLTQSCRADAAALAPDAIAALLPQVPGWSIADGKLLRRFTFKNYYDTMAFVNALAWISHHQDHHPELTVTYKECAVRYNTHSAGGALSDNDFICAAKANALFGQRSGA